VLCHPERPVILSARVILSGIVILSDPAILSGVTASLREAVTQSKDPYPQHDSRQTLQGEQTHIQLTKIARVVAGDSPATHPTLFLGLTTEASTETINTPATHPKATTVGIS